MKILICGDTKPCNKNSNLFIENNLKELVGDYLYNLFETSDLNVFNLECPLTNSSSKIFKNGPHLKADPRCINFFNNKKTLVCLSNNHIYDYGHEGFTDTLNILKKNNINHIGYIKDGKIYNKFVQDNVVIFNVCEHEFSYNDTLKEGASCIDILPLIKDIQSEKDKYIIIIYHGGKELYQYPTPNLQNLCRNLIDFGVNLIVCQHSHCLGAYEKYLNGMIIYGQGDFLFHSNNNLRKYGVMLSIDTKKENNIDFYFYSKQDNGTIRYDNNEIIVEDFKKRSNEILNHDKVESLFDKYCIENGASFIYLLKPHNRISNFINYKILKFYTIKKLSSKKATSLLNKIECEPHRETISRYLKILLETKNKK